MQTITFTDLKACIKDNFIQIACPTMRILSWLPGGAYEILTHRGTHAILPEALNIFCSNVSGHLERYTKEDCVWLAQDPTLYSEEGYWYIKGMICVVYKPYLKEFRDLIQQYNRGELS